MDQHVPSVPISQDPQEHRPKIDAGVFPFNAAVARTVPKKEVQSNPEALKAVITEWDQLRKAGCWDESDVREWDMYKYHVDVASINFLKAFEQSDVCKLTGHVFPSGTSPARSRSAASPRDESMGRPSAKGIVEQSAASAPTSAPTLPDPTTRRLV